MNDSLSEAAANTVMLPDTDDEAPLVAVPDEDDPQADSETATTAAAAAAGMRARMDEPPGSAMRARGT